MRAQSDPDLQRRPTGAEHQGHPLELLDLPRRALNALQRGGIHTLEEAAEWSDRDLLSLPHIGPASIANLRKLIAQRISGCRDGGDNALLSALQ